MLGLTMDYPLTVTAIARRAEALFGDRPIVSRRPDRTLHRSTYAEWLASRPPPRRARSTGSASRPGDRVATLCWNHDRHLEAYFAVPLHRRGAPHAQPPAAPRRAGVHRPARGGPGGDRGRSRCCRCWSGSGTRAELRHVIVVGDGGDAPPGMLDYERCSPAAPERTARRSPSSTSAPRRSCATPPAPPAARRASSTRTGRWCSTRWPPPWPTASRSSAADVVLAVVPMFHANAWGLPFTAALTGAGLVFPGPASRRPPHCSSSAPRSASPSAPASPPSGSACSSGSTPARARTTSRALRTIVIGGAAAPESLVRGARGAPRPPDRSPRGA